MKFILVLILVSDVCFITVDQCSKPCGGGVMSRKVLCFIDNRTVDANNCDPSLIHFSSETCNNNPCSKGEWCFKHHIFNVFTFNCILVLLCGMIYVAWLLHWPYYWGIKNYCAVLEDIPLCLRIILKWSKVIHCIHRHLSFYKYFGLMMACIGQN